MKFHADKMAPIIARYPKNDLGFYAVDWSRNTLSRGVDPMLMAASMRDLGNYGDGTCSMLELAGTGFKCKGWVGSKGMGGGGGAARRWCAWQDLPSIPTGNGSVSCVASVASTTGARGQLGCAAKAVAGMTFNPRTTSAQSLLSQGILGGQAGVRDPKCALSAEAGNKGGQTESRSGEEGADDVGQGEGRGEQGARHRNRCRRIGLRQDTARRERSQAAREPRRSRCRAGCPADAPGRRRARRSPHGRRRRELRRQARQAALPRTRRRTSGQSMASTARSAEVRRWEPAAAARTPRGAPMRSSTASPVAVRSRRPAGRTTRS